MQVVVEEAVKRVFRYNSEKNYYCWLVERSVVNEVQLL